MILYLAGAETWDKLMDECGVNYALASFYYLRNKSDKVLERILTNFDKIFLDSGAFTLRQHLKLRYTNLDPETIREHMFEYVDEYAEFLNHYGEAFDEVAEVDVGTWQQKTRYREELMSRVDTNINLMPVVHRRDPDRYLEFLCNKYNHVALATVRHYSTGEDANYMARRFMKTKKYQTPVHGFAITTPYLIRKLDYYSVDSATWVHSVKHGMTFIFDNGKFYMYDNQEKWRRVQLKQDVKGLGLSWDDFMNGEPDTVRRYSLYQWIQYQEYLEKEDTKKRKEYWRESEEVM